MHARARGRFSQPENVLVGNRHQRFDSVSAGRSLYMYNNTTVCEKPRYVSTIATIAITAAITISTSYYHHIPTANFHALIISAQSLAIPNPKLKQVHYVLQNSARPLCL